jgi:hypothetical protein
MLNKKGIGVWMLIISVAATSCNNLRLLVPKKKAKTQYINYRELFGANEEDKPKLPTQLVDESFNGKVRIITINKITGDTIVEWVNPVTIGTKKMIMPNQGREEVELETEYLALTDSSDIIKEHKAIVFVDDKNLTEFSKRNDTLFVNTTPEKSKLLLRSLMFPAAKAEQPIIATPTPSESKGVIASTNKQITRIKNKLNRREAKEKIKENIAKESKETILKDSAVNTSLVEILNSNNDNKELKVIDASVLIGDLEFDNDAKAQIISDQTELQQILSSKRIDWKSFRSKLKVQYKTKDDSKSFTSTLRMKKDEGVWLSIFIPVIGELYRGKVSQDSVSIIDKLKNKFYHYPSKQLQEFVHMPINNQMLQDILLGNVPYTNNAQFVGKKSEKGFAIKIIDKNTTWVYTFLPNKSLKKILVYGVSDGKPFRVINNFSEFEMTANGPVSMKRELKVLNEANPILVTIELNKAEFDAELEMPFTIPASFKDGNIEEN